MALDPKELEPQIVGLARAATAIIFKAGANVVEGLIVVSGWSDPHPICIQATSAAAATTNGTLYWVPSSVTSGEYSIAYEKSVATLDTSAAAVGDPVFVNTAGAVGLSAGATSRVVGRVANVSATGTAILSLGA
jgi:hypothetical protein